MIGARATVDARGQGKGGFIQIAHNGCVIAIAHQDRRADDAATVPHKCVIAGAGADFTGDLAACHRNAVIATADTDVAANSSARHDDGVVAKSGDQISQDLPAGHIERIVVELHVYPADGASGHLREVTVFEGADDRPAGHQEIVEALTLRQRLDASAVHDEGVDTVVLMDFAGDHPVVDLQSIGAIALVKYASEGAGVHFDGVVAAAKRHIAIDGAGAIGGERQGVVARQIGQRSTGGAVTDEVIVASGGGEGAGGEGGRRPACTQPKGKGAGGVTVLG